MVRALYRIRSQIVIPAKAGIHHSGGRASDKWIPACAGTTVKLALDGMI